MKFCQNSKRRARRRRMKAHFGSCVWSMASHAMAKISASATSLRKRIKRPRCISIKVVIWARRSLSESDRADYFIVLKALEIDGHTPPEPGTKLQIDGAPAGEITSAAYSPALGKVVALGYVRVEQAEPG